TLAVDMWTTMRAKKEQAASPKTMNLTKVQITEMFQTATTNPTVPKALKRALRECILTTLNRMEFDILLETASKICDETQGPVLDSMNNMMKEWDKREQQYKAQQESANLESKNAQEQSSLKAVLKQLSLLVTTPQDFELLSRTVTA